MGAVYLAFDEQKSRQVAVKVLADALASNQAYVDRFYREARSGSLLNHPNIVRCLNVGCDGSTGKHYLLLEYVDGPSAQTLLEQFGRLPVADAVHIALDIARGLEHAHSRNIVHRDIKPGNILITLAGVSKLADLGLAKRTDEASHLTATRQGFGTPHYMPYEQALNAKRADARSDIYALGATLYQLVTGEVPFPGDNHLEVVEKKGVGEFRPASAANPEVPAVLDAILERMMAREPRMRYQTASELIIDLERSRLAAPVPSFIDPDRAMQDPWVRACMASNEVPTCPDLETPHSGLRPLAGPTKHWHLRYQGRDGRWHKARATTEQIVRRMQKGTVRVALQAAASADGTFQPLEAYPEFLSVKQIRRHQSPAETIRPQESGTPASKVNPPCVRCKWAMWVGASVGLAILVAALIMLI